jgi:uncharacterized protein
VTHDEQVEVFATRLRDGTDLRLAIEGIAAERRIGAGVVLSAVGSLHTTRLRAPVVGEPTYFTPGPVEINALQGTVSEAGCHLHLTVSDTAGRSWGGHLSEGCTVRLTCELVIAAIPGVRFSRERDEATGYDELRVDPA